MTTMNKGLEAAPEIDPSQRKDAIDFLMEWLNDPKAQPYCALLGEYGMGKTTTCKALAKHLLDLRDKEAKPFRYRSISTSAMSANTPAASRCSTKSWSASSSEAGRAVQRALASPPGTDRPRRKRRAGHLGRPRRSAGPPGSRTSGPDPFTRQLVPAILPHRPKAVTLGVARCSSVVGHITFRTLARPANPLPRRRTATTCAQRRLSGPLRPAALHHGADSRVSSRHTLQRREPGPRDGGAEDPSTTWTEMAERPYTLSLIAQEFAQIERWKAEGRRVTGLMLYRHMVLSWLERDHGQTPDRAGSQAAC